MRCCCQCFQGWCGAEPLRLMSHTSNRPRCGPRVFLVRFRNWRLLANHSAETSLLQRHSPTCQRRVTFETSRLASNTPALLHPAARRKEVEVASIIARRREGWVDEKAKLAWAGPLLLTVALEQAMVPCRHRRRRPAEHDERCVNRFASVDTNRYSMAQCYERRPRCHVEMRCDDGGRRSTATWPAPNRTIVPCPIPE